MFTHRSVRGRDFAKLCRFDMENAEKSIVVFSGFITQEPRAQMETFSAKNCSRREGALRNTPTQSQWNDTRRQGRTALTALESLGVAIDLRNDIHEKVVLIDNKIVWFGSLNPLSHTRELPN